jgi:hypothetical protein
MIVSFTYSLLLNHLLGSTPIKVYMYIVTLSLFTNILQNNISTEHGNTPRLCTNITQQLNNQRAGGLASRSQSHSSHARALHPIRQPCIAQTTNKATPTIFAYIPARALHDPHIK